MIAQPRATAQDLNELTFWLWAFLSDAEALLAADRRISGWPRSGVAGGFDEREARLRLGIFHLVGLVGDLLRVLDRAHVLFPTIEPAYQRASHLVTEGRALHEAALRAAERAVRARTSSRRTRFADEDAPSGATALVVDRNGHWIGGRLNVELAVKEATAIQRIAATIPPPP